jgi:hypothetical protein
MPWLNWKPSRSLYLHPVNSLGGLNSQLTDPNSRLTPEQIKEMVAAPASLELKQGLGFYPDKLWDAVKSGPIVQAHISNGDLIVVTNAMAGDKGKEAAKPAKSLPEDLGEMGVNDAVEFAEGCHDVEQLEAWLQAEKESKKRGKVLEALEASLKREAKDKQE